MGRRRSRLRRLLVLLALVGAGAYWWRRSTRLPEPDMRAAPSWPPLEPATGPPAQAAPASSATAAQPPTGAATAPSPAATAPSATASAGQKPVNGAARADTQPVAEAWVAPVGGACPEGYPVKATRSGVFHVPGGTFYERATPERCYATPAAAETDGYRASKR